MGQPTDSEAEDNRLVEAARGGEVRALESLLDRHEARVLRLLRLLGVPAQDREDVAQEVFIRVFRHLGSFRTGRPFGAWLYRVTVNAGSDYRTRRGRVARLESPLDDGIDIAADESCGPAEGMRRGDLKRALEQALGSLTERERAVFVLREMEQLGTGQVASILGITSITVRRHVSRARSRLRSCLAGDEEQEKKRLVERLVPRRGSNQ